VRSRNLENEEAKARYSAVENTTTMGCNVKKTNKHLQGSTQKKEAARSSAISVSNGQSTSWDMADD
jgi:hypothetical protein